MRNYRKKIKTKLGIRVLPRERSSKSGMAAISGGIVPVSLFRSNVQSRKKGARLVSSQS